MFWLHLFDSAVITGSALTALEIRANIQVLSRDCRVLRSKPVRIFDTGSGETMVGKHPALRSIDLARTELHGQELKEPPK